MKPYLSLIGFSVVAAVEATFAAGPTIPQRPTADVFQKLTEEWPFALATVAAPVAAPVAGWASNYYVGGIGKQSENGIEEAYVSVKSKDGQASFSLFGNKPNADDVSVAGIESSENLLNVRVTLKKGSEFAVIKFDEAILQGPPQQASPQQPPRPGMPGGPGMKQPLNRPAGANGAIPRPATLPGNAPVPLPGPSNTNVAPANSAPNVPNPNAPRQRVRVIQSTP